LFLKDINMASPPYSLTERNANPPRGKTILITGGASGIGLATALYLHTGEYKNNVVALDRAENPPSVAELRKSPRFLYLPCDVTDWVSQRNAFAKASEFYGGIDCVFVNAGIAEYGEQIWTDSFDSNGQLQEPDRRCIDIDIRAVGDTLKLCMYHLRNDSDSGTSKRKGSGRGRGGSIVMTASLAGYLASAGAPLYSAAKHGVVGYLRALKGDCAKAGIAISVIAPGITLTPIILGRRTGQTLQEWGKDMGGRGVPINNAETIGLTVANLMGQGQKANGSGVLIQANRCQELEGGIAKGRGEWMGREMLDLFRGGRNAPLFPNKL
jgi:NAD(P)-dependent dehydrogenase (short-subunit alcohol dehydrogenase family)